MAIYFTSDQHFGQTHCIKMRKFKSPEEQDKALVKAWNSVVGKDDVVFVLGDFCKARPSYYAGLLNGKITIVPGNHDKKWRKDKKELKKLKKRGVRVTEESKAIKIGNVKIVLRHKRNLKVECDLMLHGHTHGKIKNKQKSYDVGVDPNHWKPISIKSILAKKEKEQ